MVAHQERNDRRLQHSLVYTVEQVREHMSITAQHPKFSDHQGWNAASRIVSTCIGMAGDAPLSWYNDPDFSFPFGEELWQKRAQLAVDVIEQLYQVPLKPEDKRFILTEMRTPRQVVGEFPERFNPDHYPTLTSDLPPQQA